MVRYATIITDDDGREVVSAIGEFEGAAPPARLGRVEQVAPGVLIGMLCGGPVDAVGGVGFAQGSLGSSDRAIGAARPMLRLAGQSGAAGSGAGRSEAARPAGATEAKAEAKSARAASKPRKRAAELKSRAAKSRTKKSARSKSRTVKSAAKPAEAGHG